MMKKTRPLSGRGTEITYWCVDDGIRAEWGASRFLLNQEDSNAILREFFTDSDEWYLLGASMTNPPAEGLGCFVYTRLPGLSPRHASAIAAILANEGYIEYRGASPIELKRSGKL